MNNFYVYIHKDFKGAPFYVGKGKGMRYLDTQHRSAWWKSKVKKMRGFTAVIIKNRLDESSAFNLEVKTIAAYKKRNIVLCNITNGGEGLSGHVFSKEHRLKIGLANSRRPYKPLSDTHKLKISLAGKGRKLSDATRLNMSKAQKGRIITDAHRLKISGEKHGRAKLTSPQVLYIRESKMPGVELSRKFNISTAQICRIRTGKKWKHL